MLLPNAVVSTLESKVQLMSDYKRNLYTPRNNRLASYSGK